MDALPVEFRALLEEVRALGEVISAWAERVPMLPPGARRPRASGYQCPGCRRFIHASKRHGVVCHLEAGRREHVRRQRLVRG